MQATSPVPFPAERPRPGEVAAARRRSAPAGSARSGDGRMVAGRGSADSAGRRLLLLDLLRASPQPRSILSLAQELKVHANTVRFHLEALLHAGQVEQLLADTAGPGRPPVLFRATHRMNPDGPTNYRLLAGMLASHLIASAPDPATVGTELGRAWGPQLLDPTTPDRHRPGRVKRGEALTHMTRILGDLGFAPEPPTGPRDATIRLRHCPFLGLVTGSVIGAVTGNDADPDCDAGAGRAHRAVICSLHLGLMQGALAALHGPVTVERLDPFVEPDLCVAHLAPAASATPTRSAAAASRPGTDVAAAVALPGRRDE